MDHLQGYKLKAVQVFRNSRITGTGKAPRPTWGAAAATSLDASWVSGIAQVAHQNPTHDGPARDLNAAKCVLRL